jgi:hypothetical protein
MTGAASRHRLAVVFAALSLLLLRSCWYPLPPPTLLADPASAPPEIRRACDMTARRCTRCHTIDRILVAQVTSPAHWEAYVRRMRRMPTSDIGEADAAEIVRCLVYRSFRTPDRTGEAP